MAEESVGQLAETIGTPVERLLLHIEEAGLPKRLSEDVILEDEKEAKQIAAKRTQLVREQNVRTQKHITLDEIVIAHQSLENGMLTGGAVILI